MMNIRKYISVATMTGLLATALIGCTKTEEIYIDDLYQKAYITSDIYPQSEGRYDISDVMSDPFFGVRENTLVYIQGLTTTLSGQQSYKIFFRTIYPVKKNLHGTLIALDESAVEAYNADRGLTGSDAYKLLPDNYYTIINCESEISEGRKEGDEPFFVEFSSEAADLEVGHYLVPLTCQIDDDSIEMSSSMGSYYVMVNHTYDDLRTGEADDVPQDVKILYSDTDFTYEVTAGSYYLESGIYSVHCLFDNDLSSSSIAATGEDMTTVTVTFNEPQKLDRIGLALYDPWGYSYGYYNYFWIDYVYDGESAENSIDNWIETAPQSEAYIYWFDAKTEMGTEKKVKQVSITVYDAYSYLSEFYFIASTK